MTQQIAVLNGPNLNLLGERLPELYGTSTLDEIVTGLRQTAAAEGLELWDFQSNSEGALVDAIQELRQQAAAIVINPGAYSHTSIALRDALESFPGPVIEVHLSNIFRREPFRRHSFISEIASGVIAGLGPAGYDLALRAAIALLREQQPAQLV